MAKSKTSKCAICGYSLERVLVYLNGRWSRRVGVFQCPNHCDLQCPHCGGKLRVTKRATQELSVHCRSCGWKGHSPDRDFTAKQAELQARLVAEKLKTQDFERRQREWRKKTPSGGSPCHECGQPLVAEMFDRKVLSESTVTWKIRIFCWRGDCTFKKIIQHHEGEPMRAEQFKFRMQSYKHKGYGSFLCPACGIRPNELGRCGCS